MHVVDLKRCHRICGHGQSAVLYVRLAMESQYRYLFVMGELMLKPRAGKDCHSC
jgi:hypothetical protein